MPLETIYEINYFIVRGGYRRGARGAQAPPKLP